MDEELFSGALSICQLMLRGICSAAGGALPPAVIAEKVDEVLTMSTYAGVDRARLLRAIEERFTVFSRPHLTLGSDDDHVAWLPAKVGNLPSRYWNRYRLYLEQVLPDSAIETIDKVSNDVLGRLEDPDRIGFWDRRGLVAGNVQSGKTASYCGLIAKAADAGYKVIIILAGIHNSLRSQTQMRIDEGFLGFMSEPRTGKGQQSFRLTGVGHIDGSVRANTGTNRAENGDFSRQVANQFGIHPGGLPLLFVVKKNVKVLDNLLAWLRSCADGRDETGERRYVRHVPVLVIDDEADLASVDTKAQAFDENGNPDPNHDPTKTNELIRRILRSFEKVAYVGYTATPFANIFIHDKGHTQELGDDLFPRSFIVNLPAPSNYMGPTRVFGIAADDDGGLDEVSPLPLVRMITDHADSDAVDETSGWMPPKLTAKTGHMPRFNGEASVPPSLRAAMLGFILACTVRRIRDSKPLHNSMLVHVVRFTKIQKEIGRQVEVELREIVQRLQHGDGSRRPTIISEFRALWDDDFIPTNAQCQAVLGNKVSPSLPDWEDVEAKLREVALSIGVKLINGSAKDALDYQEHKAVGMNVIAIGGDKLSRGLTLEGLTVSYFLRASRMYDTLMQMGRWFGYRDGFIDVCRLYTTSEINEWFAHIAAAGEELQREFEYMVSVGGTPKDYGLKVRSHPLLLVTSAVKMRNGTKLKLSFSGDISETIIFDKNPDWLRRNFNAVQNWLSLLGEPNSGGRAGGYTWKEVAVDRILALLASYNSHEDARRANMDLLSRYIVAQRDRGELITWTVHLASSRTAEEDNETSVAGQPVGLIKRSRFPKELRSDRYSIRRLLSPADELVDMSPAIREEALAATIDRWQKEPEPKRGDQPTAPSGVEIRQRRPKTNGLLLLYPLDPSSAEMSGFDVPIMGLAISFPKSETAREISYIVDNVFVRRGGDDESF